VRDLLGDVLLERAAIAEQARDADADDELRGRLTAYDADGSRRARLAAPGRITVRAPGAAIAIDGAAAGTGSASLELAPGLHFVDVTAPGRAGVHEPIVVERDATTALDLVPPPAAAVPDGYVYIAPGWFGYGSAADEDTRRTFLSTVPLHRRHTDGYLIARTEVTFGDWIAYVEAQPETARDALLPNLPARLGGAGVQLERAGTSWRLTLAQDARRITARWGEPLRYDGRTRHAVQDWRRLPVLGISATEAAGYMAWLDRSGRLPGARLCSELEWERAARGPDGRSTPSGRLLEPDDANIDLTYGHALMGPDEVGSHPGSVSPYGLEDTAGNAFEWTRAERSGCHVVRGGSYYHDRKTADLANRNELCAEVREPTAGLRVCATLR
ncbi:MAG TPA: SUMF1/EgtB/PvdO family nonheme iron enzyme, partial [Kofleriaceae bacterium]|nr:SUMF1/EgtB/PvdO family nonheme iron enzyme [Kofleriaceae bacterium]